MAYLLPCFPNVLDFQPYAHLSCELIRHRDKHDKSAL